MNDYCTDFSKAIVTLFTVLECNTPAASIPNGMLLSKQLRYHVGDYIEYQCNIGYTPRRSTLQCGNNGQWAGTVPTCAGNILL